MAYDLLRGQCVAFGGWDAPVGLNVFQDTWEYDGVTWVLRAPATIPPERDSHAMAFDVARGQTVMIGGWDFNFNLLNRTWEWDGVDWVDRQPLNAPSPRRLAAMTYDAVRGVTVLFGGLDAAVLGDTWEWNGVDWVQSAPPVSPPPRRGHAMAYDQARGVVVLFGGRDATNLLLDDTWEYDGATWTQVALDGAPSPRTEHALVYDLARSRCVLFGGDNGFESDETWEYDGVRWHEVFSAARPPANVTMAAAYDVARSRVVLHGGFDGLVAVGDTWEYGGDEAQYRAFGTGCVGGAGLTPQLVPTAMPVLGTTTSVDITDLPIGGGVAALFLGLSDQVWSGLPLPLDLTVAGLSGCRAYVSADASVTLNHAAGTTSWSLAVPANPLLSGFQLFLQAFSLDAAAPRPVPGALSRALELNVR
ncbi:MAG: kelch repeat-containing protein [Planctomycetota bacterium]